MWQVFVRVQRPDGTLEPKQELDALSEPGTGDYVWLAGRRRVEVRGAERDSDGRLRYLIAVDRPTDGQTRPREASVIAIQATSVLGVAVEVTAEAAETIVNHGGTVFLWQEDVGREWVRDRLSFDRPTTVQGFQRIPAGLVLVLIAEGIELPETLKLSTSRLIPSRLNVEWDRETWGWRGAGDGGGG
jgi:hypothetical protein